MHFIAFSLREPVPTSLENALAAPVRSRISSSLRSDLRIQRWRQLSLLPDCYRGSLGVTGKLSHSRGGSAMATAGKAMSFVARIWLESGPNGDARWRGYVKHVQSGRGGFFDDLHALRIFVERVSGITGSTLRPRRRHSESSSAGPMHKGGRARPRKKHV